MSRRATVLVAVVLIGAAGSLAVVATRPGSDRSTSPAVRSDPIRDTPVRAAAGFLTGLTLAKLLDDQRRRRFVARWAHPARATELQQLYATEAQRVAASYANRPRVSRAAVLGYREEPGRRGGRIVTLWAISIGGAGASPVAVGWRSIRVELLAYRRAWRIVRVAETPGPSPDMSAAELRDASRRFRSLDAAP